MATKKKEEEKYAGLTNQELILVYYRLENYLNVMNKNLDKNVITRQVDTPMGVATAMREVKPEHVEMFKETAFYNTLCEVVTKLKPIAELIEECDDSLKKLIEEFK
jgi:hypothetical protein